MPPKNEHDNIGPGSYDPHLPPSKFYSSFSFGYKFSSNIENNNPGPGTYPKENEQVSTLSDEQKSKILPKIPSEGQLNKDRVLKTENSTISKKNSLKNLGFSCSHRDDLYNKEHRRNPGPGSYEVNFKATKPDPPSFKYKISII